MRACDFLMMDANPMVINAIITTNKLTKAIRPDRYFVITIVTPIQTLIIHAMIRSPEKSLTLLRTTEVRIRYSANSKKIICEMESDMEMFITTPPVGFEVSASLKHIARIVSDANIRVPVKFANEKDNRIPRNEGSIALFNHANIMENTVSVIDPVLTMRVTENSVIQWWCSN